METHVGTMAAYRSSINSLGMRIEAFHNKVQFDFIKSDAWLSLMKMSYIYKHRYNVSGEKFKLRTHFLSWYTREGPSPYKYVEYKIVITKRRSYFHNGKPDTWKGGLMVDAKSLSQSCQNVMMANNSIKLTVLGAGFNKRVSIILGRKVVK